ncbi:hypothetical protein QEN19_004154 [Hanseniaspora menglaensis]
MNFTISRQQFLNWINDILSLNFTKIEDLGPGSGYLQLLDYINVTMHQNESLPMNQVYWTMDVIFEDNLVNAENKRLKIIKNPQLAGKEQMMANYKLLQKWFQELKITKNIPIEKLVMCKFQNNLEFAQWLFKYFAQMIKTRGFDDVDTFCEYVKKEGLYDPIGRRFTGAKNGSRASSVDSRRSSLISKKSNGSLNGSTLNSSAVQKQYPLRSGSNSSATRRSPSLVKRDNSRNFSPSKNQRTSSTLAKTHHNMDFDVQETHQIQELMTKYENIIQAINSERQFYFDKLRSLELLILAIQENNRINENPELQQLVTHILKILYTNANEESVALKKDFVANEDLDLNDHLGNADDEVKKTVLGSGVSAEKRILSIDDSEMF